MLYDIKKNVSFKTLKTISFVISNPKKVEGDFSLSSLVRCAQLWMTGFNRFENSEQQLEGVRTCNVRQKKTRHIICRLKVEAILVSEKRD